MPAIWKELLHEKASPAEEDSHRRHASLASSLRCRLSLQAARWLPLVEKQRHRRRYQHSIAGFRNLRVSCPVSTTRRRLFSGDSAARPATSTHMLGRTRRTRGLLLLVLAPMNCPWQRVPGTCTSQHLRLFNRRRCMRARCSPYGRSRWMKEPFRLISFTEVAEIYANAADLLTLETHAARRILRQYSFMQYISHDCFCLPPAMADALPSDWRHNRSILASRLLAAPPAGKYHISVRICSA